MFYHVFLESDQTEIATDDEIGFLFDFDISIFPGSNFNDSFSARDQENTSSMTQRQKIIHVRSKISL